jgi:hypothetical protein
MRSWITVCLRLIVSLGQHIEEKADDTLLERFNASYYDAWTTWMISIQDHLCVLSWLQDSKRIYKSYITCRLTALDWKRSSVSIIAFVDTTTTTRYIAISISNIVFLIRIRDLIHRLIFTIPASTLFSRNGCSILISCIGCPTVHLLATVDLAVTGSLRWQVDYNSQYFAPVLEF